MNGRKSGVVRPAHIPRWTHPWLRLWWPGTEWATDTDSAVHLTFDDGPDPDVTPWVLDELAARGMKATFFVVGEQAERHPDLLAHIQAAGHTLGGHTMRHEHGWKTGVDPYVESAVASLEAASSSGVFRPPYGKFTRTQAKRLSTHASIVMWDVLSGDHAIRDDRGIEAARHRLRKHTRPGSIVVFHDSAKHGEAMRRLLPSYLDWLAGQGWTSTGLQG